MIVVYVEDNLANVRLMERICERQGGVELVPVPLGANAVQVVQDRDANLVLLDLYLPDISGADVLRALRSNQKTARVPVVILTADANASTRERVLRMGASRMLTKPFELSDMFAILDEYAAKTPKPEADVISPG